MACYFGSDGSISCTFQPHKEQRIHSKRKIGNSMGITTGEDRLPRLGIAIDLNQLRDLMREFVAEAEQDADLQVQLNWTLRSYNGSVSGKR